MENILIIFPPRPVLISAFMISNKQLHILLGASLYFIGASGFMRAMPKSTATILHYQYNVMQQR